MNIENTFCSERNRQPVVPSRSPILEAAIFASVLSEPYQILSLAENYFRKNIMKSFEGFKLVSLPHLVKTVPGHFDPINLAAAIFN